VSARLKFSQLPKAIQAQVLGELGRAQRPRPKAPKSLPASAGIRTCACGSQIYRPDGRYPAACDVCSA
jgi:hypothetical protein